MRRIDLLVVRWFEMSQQLRVIKQRLQFQLIEQENPYFHSFEGSVNVFIFSPELAANLFCPSSVAATERFNILLIVRCC